MSLAEAIREMVANGATPEDIGRMVAGYESAVDKRSAHAKRQARYAERKRQKASESVSLLTPSASVSKRQEASESVSKMTPLARVEDNLLPLEGTGFQEGDEFQVSRETFNSFVPEGKIALRRKERVELCQTVVGMWNEAAGSLGLVAVRDITAARQAAIVARSADLVKTFDFPDALAGWRTLMGSVRGSPYLRGEINGFRCDFDFVTRSRSFTKIMEGFYEARQTSGRRR